MHLCIYGTSWIHHRSLLSHFSRSRYTYLFTYARKGLPTTLHACLPSQFHDGASVALADRMVRAINTTTPFLAAAAFTSCVGQIYQALSAFSCSTQLVKAPWLVFFHIKKVSMWLIIIVSMWLMTVAVWWLVSRRPKNKITAKNLGRLVMLHAAILCITATLNQLLFWHHNKKISCDEMGDQQCNQLEWVPRRIALQLIGELGWYYTMIMAWYGAVLRPPYTIQCYLCLFTLLMYATSTILIWGKVLLVSDLGLRVILMAMVCFVLLVGSRHNEDADRQRFLDAFHLKVVGSNMNNEYEYVQI